MANKIYSLTIGNEFQTELQLSSLTEKLKQLKPGEYNLVAVKKGKKRSLAANKYYRVILCIISNETGNTPDALHEYFKREFNPDVVILKKDITLVGGSTADLESRDFWDYLEQIKIWASEFLEIQIPGPNEIPDDVYLSLIESGYIK